MRGRKGSETWPIAASPSTIVSQSEAFAAPNSEDPGTFAAADCMELLWELVLGQCDADQAGRQEKMQESASYLQ